MGDSPNDVVSAEEDTSTRVVEYPLVVVRKKMPVVFCYRDPGNHAKCYTFHLKYTYTTFLLLLCTKCNHIYTCDKKNNTDHVPYPRGRKLVGNFMIEDPTQGHAPGCEPDDFLELMQKYNLEDDTGNNGGDKLQCADIMVDCSSLQTKPLLSSLSQVDFPTCPPPPVISEVCYSATAKTEIEQDSNIPMGQNNMLTVGENKSTPEYPVVVVRKNTPVIYIYRDPGNLAKCYRFHIKPNSTAACLKCLNLCDRNYRKKRIANKIPCPSLRKFVGDFMIEDPTQGHLSGCEPDCFLEVMKKYTLEDGTGNYGLSTGEANVHSLLDDLQYLYRYPDTRVEQLLQWNWIPFAATYGFETDPTMNHHPDCLPLLYRELMEKYEVVGEETARKALRGHNRKFSDDLVDYSPISKKTRMSLADTNLGQISESRSMMLTLSSTAQKFYSAAIKAQIEEDSKMVRLNDKIDLNVGDCTVSEKIKREEEKPLCTSDPASLTTSSSNERDGYSRDDCVVYFC